MECFNRSRVDGLQLVCNPFCLLPGVSMLARVECYARVHHYARPGASMLARVECYARVPFAPVLVPPYWHGWSVTPVCHLRPS